MKISVENNLACITQATPEEYDWIRHYLSVTEPQFRKNWRTGRMERVGVERISFVDKRKFTFPAGFVRLLIKGAKEEDPPITLEFKDLRKPPSLDPDDEVDTSYLRYYQQEALERIVKRRRGIIWHPTAAGKTVVAVALTQRIPLNWLFLVRSKDLLHQTAKKYAEITGLRAGIIGDGIVDIHEEGNLVVATAQSLQAKRGEEVVWDVIRNAEGIIVDECHQTPANTIYKITVSAEKAAYRVGLSGTPLDRSDRKSMLTIGALGPVIHRVKTDELVGAGFLSYAKIEMHKIYQESTKPTYQGAYGELVVRSTSRNKLLVDLMKRAEKPNWTFVKEIKHGKALKERAERAGLRVEFVWGNKNTPQRESAITRLIRGDTDCIICSVIFQEGVDVPELRSIVIGTGGKSAIATLQRIGRGMRVTDTKKSFEVYDIYDDGNKWMKRHASERKRSYEREGHKVKVIDSQEEMDV